ncbi:MAG: hypothetical protein JXB17_02195 [Bacteroidales bacterium]|nr:hypothetical protein [Bacteroidales bacterium]
MELKKLIKNTSFLASTTFVQFVAGIFRSKLGAIYLGVDGMGIFSQLNFLTQQIAQFSTLSMSEATVKQIAENKAQTNAVELIKSALKSYIVLVFSFMLISILGLFLLAGKLTVYVFGDNKYQLFFYVAVFTLPLLILNSIPFAILKGYKNVKAISRARIFIILINIIVFIPLILVFNLNGVVVFVPFSYLSTLAINYLFAKKHHLTELGINLKSILSSPVKKEFTRELITFSGFGLSVMLYIIVSDVICRAIIVTQLGIDAIGLYSPIITWAGLFTGFLLPTFSTYLYPRYCETKTNEEVSGILNDGLRLSTLYLIPLLFLAIPFKELLLRVFYSVEFLESAKYLPYHFIGLVFYVWFYSMAMALTPTGRIKWNGIFWVIYCTINISVVYFLTSRIGLYSWMLKYIIGPVIFFLLVFVFFNKVIRFHLTKANLILMVYLLSGSLGLIMIENFLSQYIILKYILSFLLLISTVFALEPKESKYLKEKIKSYITFK